MFKKRLVNRFVASDVIAQRIFYLRGQKVMLDRDLAKLYGVETRALNQAVRRNFERFPDDFMFSLTRDEILSLSQIVISSDIKYAPSVLVFTEQGIAMLSSVLRSKRAILVNIEIMRAFVKLRHVLTTHKKIASKLRVLEKKVGDHDDKIQAIFEAIRQLMAEPKKNKGPMGFVTGK